MEPKTTPAAALYVLPREVLYALAYSTGAVAAYRRMLGEEPELHAWPQSGLVDFLTEHARVASSS